MWKITTVKNMNQWSDFEYHLPTKRTILFKDGVAYVNDESVLHYFTRETGKYIVEKVQKTE